MKIRYLVNVASPRNQIGKAGDVRDVDLHIARILIGGGFAEQIRTRKAKGQKDADERRDSTGTGHSDGEGSGS